MKKILDIILMILICLSMTVYAEEKSFTGEGEYVLNKSDTLERAESEAMKEALSQISMKAIVEIKNKIKTEDNRVTEDRLQMITKSLIKIEDKKTNISNSESGKIKLIVKLKAKVDVDLAQRMLEGENSQSKVKIEKTNKPNEFPVDWWKDDLLVAEGTGFVPDYANNIHQAKAFAKKAAMMDAYRNLAIKASGIRITANQSVVAGEVEAVIRGAEVIEENYDDFGNCTVKMQVPIYGVENSIAEKVFKKVERKEFLEPTSETQVKGNYTGLIIECGGMEIRPVLNTIIFDSDNRSIYSYENLDYDTVKENGMIGYLETKKIINIRANNKKSRAGSNPYIAKGIRTSNGNVVISKEDSNRILAENKISHFLDNGAVVYKGYNIQGAEY